MRQSFYMDGRALLGGLILAGSLTGSQLHAQTVTPSNGDEATYWQRYDWLKPAEEQQRQAMSGATYSATTTQDVKDPFFVLSTGSLWQEKYNTVYTQKVVDSLSLTYEMSSTMLSETAGTLPDDLSRGQSAGFKFSPADQLTFAANVHNSMTDSLLPGDSVTTTGTAFTAEGHLPYNATLMMGYRTDQSSTDAIASAKSMNSACDAQFKQPLGKLPLTAVVKGHYETAGQAGGASGTMPSLEQSLVWKPLQDTTVQMGLRQQQYQEYPGVDNQFNHALFADWSQKMTTDVSWHSYAELLNTRSMVDQAPAAPLASGANGTAQATPPGSNISATSALPVSLQDQTFTFSTGPSFKVQKDISASVEYSNRWDKTPAAGSVGQEQRVSVSIKGTF